MPTLKQSRFPNKGPSKPVQTGTLALTPPTIGLHWKRSEGSSDEELRDRKLKALFYAGAKRPR
jgi:hypothetical protein